MADSPFFRIDRVEAARIVDLRHRILRAGLPRSEALFAGDDAATSLHVAALDESGTPVGCASFLAAALEGEPGIQLRGMAVERDLAGRGVGRAVLEFGVPLAREICGPAGAVVWCNARITAMGFYERMGWRVISGLFDIPTAGPHFRMRLD